MSETVSPAFTFVKNGVFYFSAASRQSDQVPERRGLQTKTYQRPPRALQMNVQASISKPPSFR